MEQESPQWRQLSLIQEILDVKMRLIKMEKNIKYIKEALKVLVEKR